MTPEQRVKAQDNLKLLIEVLKDLRDEPITQVIDLLTEMHTTIQPGGSTYADPGVLPAMELVHGLFKAAEKVAISDEPTRQLYANSAAAIEHMLKSHKKIKKPDSAPS